MPKELEKELVKMKTFKVVLTGGPCGGKTESIMFLSDKLIGYGYSVSFIEETADLLLKMGFMPNENISTFDFQDLLLKIQFIREYSIEGKTEVLLCDRGLLDGKAYIDNDSFKKILDNTNLDEISIMNTYDTALYFRSISYELPELFIQKRIYESPSKGQLRDEQCRRIWNSKISQNSYNNLDGLTTKQKLALSSLLNKLKSLNINEMKNLSDYYKYDQFESIIKQLNEMIDRCVPSELKDVTRRLIK